MMILTIGSESEVLFVKFLKDVSCDPKFFYKTAESLEKRCQIWILWIYKNIVEEAKNVHFLK